MLQSRQHDLLARLLDLAGQEDLVEDGVDLVEVEDQVQLADVAEEGVEDLDEEVDGLEEGELVVVGVDAGAEEEARVPPVDDLVVAELDEVGLVLLVAGRYEAVDLVVGKECQILKESAPPRPGVGYLALELDLLVVAVRRVPLGKPSLAPEIPVVSILGILRLSATAAGREAGATHWRFCMSINDSILGAGSGAAQDDVATLKLRGVGDAAPSRDVLAWVLPSQRPGRPLSLAEAEGSPVAGANASLATRDSACLRGSCRCLKVLLLHAPRISLSILHDPCMLQSCMLVSILQARPLWRARWMFPYHPPPVEQC